MPSSTGFTSGILLLASWMITATVPATCYGDARGRYDVISWDWNRDRTYYYDLKFSWDAGVLDGIIHLTADDVYQPPVQHPPDAKRSAGRVILSPRKEYTGYITQDLDPIKIGELASHDTSFNTSFTMSINRSPAAQRDDGDGGLLFEVLRSVRDGFDRTIYHPLVNTTTSFNVSVEIGTLEYYYDQGTHGVYVSVSPAAWTTPAANHTVWVDYDAVGHNLSVYVVDDDSKPKPDQATLHAALNIDDIIGRGYNFYKSFGLFASKNRSLPSCQPVIYNWNLTADVFIWEWVYPREQHHARRRRSWFLPIALSSSVLVAAGAAIVFVALRWSRLVSWYRALMMRLKLSRALRRLPGIPREFKFADVKKATRNFQESNRLGRGGFGAVYKGTMVTKTATGEGRQRQRRYVEIAVKKFTRKDYRGYDDFLAEVAIINRLRHKNIVPLLGWCYENGELLLIYQYMPNGSLDQHLFHRQQQTLPWETRYRVVSDIAAALHYVHNEYERVVLHRDIKASNIMLDANFSGRLGDFGLAGLVDADKTSLTDLAVAGTWGFIAPEYPLSHKATRQTDVYAFGVLILEIVTGKRSLGEAGTELQQLTDWVWWLHGEGRLLEAVDDDLAAATFDQVDDPDVSTRLLESVDDLGSTSTRRTEGGEFDTADPIRLLLLGLACTNPNPADRPSTADLVQVIAKRIAPPVVPLVKPRFVWPLEGEVPVLDDELELDEDFVEMPSHDEEPDDHSDTRTLSREGLTLSIGSLSLEIMVSRSRVKQRSE